MFKNRLLLSGLISSALLSGCVLSVSDSSNGSSSYTPKAEIERKYYGKWEPEYGYTQVVKVGDTLHISGIPGTGDNMEAQIDSVYTFLKDILADYGATTDNIVKETIYTTDIKALGEAYKQRLEYYNKDKYPASTWVEISGLFSPAMMIEVETTVVLD
ncbi:RidA family protein [Alteromonadaceae bacterium M269]|nr:RidA family protein [Alteromonadaceae bacterium M269]